jgi:hypothetical protein
LATSLLLTAVNLHFTIFVISGHSDVKIFFGFLTDKQLPAVAGSLELSADGPLNFHRCFFNLKIIFGLQNYACRRKTPKQYI